MYGFHNYGVMIPHLSNVELSSTIPITSGVNCSYVSLPHDLEKFNAFSCIWIFLSPSSS